MLFICYDLLGVWYANQRQGHAARDETSLASSNLYVILFFLLSCCAWVAAIQSRLAALAESQCCVGPPEGLTPQFVDVACL